MKIKERALSLLLSLVMVLTFMPALAFAESDEANDAAEAPAVEDLVVEEPVEEEPMSEEPVVEEPAKGDFVEVPAVVESTTGSKAGEVSWEIEGIEPEYSGWILPTDDYDTLYAYGITTDDEIALQYQWLKSGTPIDDWQALSIASNKTFKKELYVTEPGEYTFSVRETGEDPATQSVSFRVYPLTVQNGLVYGPMWEGAAYVNVDWRIDERTLTGNIDIPATISLADGTTRAVKYVNLYAPNASSASITANVSEIENLGFSWDETAEKYTPIPGFTIFGTTGTYAQTYAAQNGLLFRDLAAEAAAAAEAARQGTPGALPSVKASKPKAAKKAITVKWKKLNKKNLKKGVSNIEIWVCTDGAFRSGATIEKVTGKKKSSLKIKGLQKGVTYYVKVRAITYSGGTKIVGPWSSVKTVKVKK